MEGISLFLNVKKPLQRPFARFEIYVDSGNGLIDLKYINETIDMCRFFREKTYMPLLQIIYRTIVDQGNYPTSCPIRKVINNLTYIWVNVGYNKGWLRPTFILQFSISQCIVPVTHLLSYVSHLNNK